MYYSDEHIKDLSTYKTPRPALLRLFPLSPQFCCEKVMKHWRSSAILLKPKPHGILGPPVSLKCPSCLDKPVSLSLLVFLSAFTWASILNQWVAIIIISLQNSKRRRILFWNNLNPIVWQGQVDEYSFMNPLVQTKGKSQGRFYSNQLNTLLEVIKSDNQSWFRLVPLCSLCNLIRRILLSFMHVKHKLLWKGEVDVYFYMNPFRGNVREKSQVKPAKDCF